MKAIIAHALFTCLCLAACNNDGSFTIPEPDCETQGDEVGGSNVDVTTSTGLSQSHFALIHQVQGESVVDHEAEEGQHIQASARCPAGEHVVSGGCDTWYLASTPDDPCNEPYLFYNSSESISYNEPYLLHGWLCMARTTCAGSNGILAYVNCAP